MARCSVRHGNDKHGVIDSEYVCFSRASKEMRFLEFWSQESRLTQRDGHVDDGSEENARDASGPVSSGAIGVNDHASIYGGG